ncbi:MAG: hypothetical protein F6K55_06645 [Moorea sp. SIO4A3]|nr:hypothetical protein [Moorena sp. SIO4A3]
MQRGLGEAARSWGGSAVLGVPPMSDCIKTTISSEVRSQKSEVKLLRLLRFKTFVIS